MLEKNSVGKKSLFSQTPASVDPAAKALLDAMETPVLLLNLKENILYANSAALAQLPAATIGTPISFCVRHPALLDALNRARQSGLPQMVEVQQSFPNPVWYSINVAPLDLPFKDQIQNAMLVTLQNRTEQRRIEAMRVDFVANASHELRTPLTSLVGFIDTLLGPAANDEEARVRFLTIMQNQAERMSTLIDDLISLSRIELRQHVRPTERVDLATILREVSEGLQNQISRANLEVTLDIPSGSAEVTGDRNELYEVFENLLDNAAKYGAGGKKIDVRLAALKERQQFSWMVSITDYGAGIAKEHVPRLTERFYRVDAQSSREKKGTGLGLAIVKHIINRHRGLLVITSELDKGTRVEVLL
ncbi:Phosphate regulon sensor protein PhoR (SphS) [hydrothermal vent metagenome]|uniref:histidine kinase n=1 Tax=hydrothermal vent metagenome TaxID=652676 RepID=A0A3B0TED9_9ZZZZ